MSAISASGSRMRAMAVRQTSSKLKGQMALAMPTAIPMLALTRMVGKVTGKRVGSFMVAS